MRAAFLRLFRLDLFQSDRTPVPTDPRAGTRVAIAFPLVAVLLVASWLGSDPAVGAVPVGAGEVAVLAGLAVFFGRFQIDFTSRYSFSFERATILLAGLLGGPLAGALVGAAGGASGSSFVWRRRATYGGLGACEGIAAGLVGLAWLEGQIPLETACMLAALLAVATNALGSYLVLLDRRIRRASLVLRGQVFDLAEIVVLVPLVAVLAGGFAERPHLVLAALASGVPLVGFATYALAVQRSAVAAERRARLRDWLTGVPSRQAFEDALEREMGRILRGARPAGLLVIDIDWFKRVNDTYRHSGGDAVLRQFARRLLTEVRREDLVARWGGEEFSLLAPEIGSLDDLAALADRLRASVAARPFRLPAGEVRMTASIGGTLLDGAVSAGATFERADEALYRAKRSRDAVCVLPPLGSPDDGGLELAPQTTF